MKKILIPVDFSEYSQCAVDYACQLTLAHNDAQELELVHVFTNQSNLYVNREYGTTLKDPQVEVAKAEMEKLKEVIRIKYPQVRCQELFKSGNLYEEVSKVTAEFQYDAVVMGTKGTSGLEALFLGSNTYDVILNTKTPVLGVPKGSDVFKKERIGLLCNFKPAEIEALQQAIQLFGNGFELILIHVNKDDRDIKLIDEQFKSWIAEIITSTGIDDISYTVKSQALYNRAVENISHAINNALIDEQIDIMLVTKSRKSFFRQILGENIVRKLAYQMTIPTLFARVHAKE
ncbi:universal stress protein [Sphingobacterium paludis]|uniref:Nucleotide-binding universal stress UspA family protein n=1 Tax=Sphingobacterium paludis TaxID=1476465 RepID=A0A4R7D545_9SPHI|nr:universal stress protein [Sphingobacterium paludis]TDS16219.1 nucleotide-binding universal stress UspA family protein [Sphingobacterium paludis]